MTETKTLTSKLRHLFLETFKLNCELDENEVTPEELSTINEISSDEIIDNLKELLTSLLLYKKATLHCEQVDLIKKSEQLEKMLQKTEAEVRNHIRTEHELKLHIESIQNHSEELETNISKLSSELKDLQDQLKTIKKPKETSEKDEIIKKLQKEIKSFKVFAGKIAVKALVTEKSKDKFEEVKQKIGEKGVELHKVQKIVGKAKIFRDRNRASRKSAHYSEGKVKGFDVSVSFTGLENNHCRSTSDNVRPKSANKRAPSR
jgi:DNA repair exonuclease SbcCD ATPase subunit